MRYAKKIPDRRRTIFTLTASLIKWTLNGYAQETTVSRKTAPSQNWCTSKILKKITTLLSLPLTWSMLWIPLRDANYFHHMRKFKSGKFSLQECRQVTRHQVFWWQKMLLISLKIISNILRYIVSMNLVPPEIAAKMEITSQIL